MKNSTIQVVIGLHQLDFLCEAHNGISAVIAEEAGFKGIWGSGLSLSAQFGVRDNNEASWTQVLEMLEFMSDATRVPILLDGDTGYGNFNNMRRLVKNWSSAISPRSASRTNSFRRPTVLSAGRRSRWRISMSSAARSKPARTRRATMILR